MDREKKINHILSDQLPMAIIAVTEDRKVIGINQEVSALFLDEKREWDVQKLTDIFPEDTDKIWSYITNPVPEGYYFFIRSRKNIRKHIKIQSRKAKVDDSTIYVLSLTDTSMLKDTLQYFEDSFDLFMDSTIKLEEALATIERQKAEIEKINEELNKTQTIMNKDLEIAVILQNELLPKLPANIPDWNISVFFQPLAGVSGDTYDFYQFEDCPYLGIVLLDASGHGISSSLITALARPTFFRHHRRYKKHPLGTAVKSANNELIRQIGGVANYLTGVSVRLFHDHITYVNAGHPYMLIMKKKSRQVLELPNDGILLGIPEFSSTFTARKIRIRPGDSILIYSDCLIEEKNSKGEEFGIERVKEVMLSTDGNPMTIKSELIRALQQFGTPVTRLSDDLTMIAVQKR